MNKYAPEQTVVLNHDSINTGLPIGTPGIVEEVSDDGEGYLVRFEESKVPGNKIWFHEWELDAA